MLDHCAKIDESELPAHSKAPWSLETPNVISVSTILTLMYFKKLMKFAIASQPEAFSLLTEEAGILTIRSCIQYNEAGIDRRSVSLVCEGYCIGMPTKPVIGLE